MLGAIVFSTTPAMMKYIARPEKPWEMMCCPAANAAGFIRFNTWAMNAESLQSEKMAIFDICSAWWDKRTSRRSEMGSSSRKEPWEFSSEPLRCQKNSKCRLAP